MRYHHHCVGRLFPFLSCGLPGREGLWFAVGTARDLVPPASSLDTALAGLLGMRGLFALLTLSSAEALKSFSLTLSSREAAYRRALSLRGFVSVRAVSLGTGPCACPDDPNTGGHGGPPLRMKPDRRRRKTTPLLPSSTLKGGVIPRIPPLRPAGRCFAA